MNPKTLTALQGSIDKWRRIEAGEIADHGIENCALCQEFYYDSCEGCPVMERTRRKHCFGSPYIAWDDAHEEMDRFMGREGLVADTPELKDLAREEREFLESLLPEKTK